MDSRTNVADRPPSGADWAAVAVVTLLAIALRAWNLLATSLDHYDEAVYALSGWGLAGFPGMDGMFARQERFSPLGQVLLVAVSFLAAGGPSDWSAMLPGIVVGSLTVPATWWVVRRWFGPGAAIVSATLIALDPFHIVLCRTALTDVTFALAFVLAMGAAVEYLARPSIGTAAVVGLASGVAWNVKYHGWFVVVVTALASLPTLIRLIPSLRALRVRVGHFIVMTVVAGASYLPWTLHVQSLPGGYGALARYQRTMLSKDVADNVQTQLFQQAFWDSPLRQASLPMGMLAAGLTMQIAATGFGPRKDSKPSPRRKAFDVAIPLAGTGLSVAVGTFPTTLAMGLLFLVSELRQRNPGETDANDEARSGLANDRRSAAGRVLFAWILLWLVMAPLYRPYARLLLPMVLAAQIAASGMLAGWVRRLVDSTGIWATAVLAILSAAVFLGSPSSAPGNPWQDASTMRTAAKACHGRIEPGASVWVVGEPGLVFYLRQHGHPAHHDLDSLPTRGAADSTTYLVTGVYAQRSPDLRKKLAELADRLETIRVIPLVPDPVRLQDDLRPDRIGQFVARPDSTFDLTLYRLKPH